jgi:hypothetical protein
MRRESLVGGLLRQLVALVLVVVACVAALHWAYEQVRAMWWLVVLITVLAAAVWLLRRRC